METLDFGSPRIGARGHPDSMTGRPCATAAGGI
jgi:hypothetical protein